MSHVTNEIASQPVCWAEAIALAKRAGGALPAPGERVAVVGCGTSYNMAVAYARLREDAGQGLTDAMPASEVLEHRAYDRYIFISRSGTTTEVYDALRRVPEGAPTTAIVGVAGSPIAGAASTRLVLDFAAERSVVQTRFATSCLVLLSAHLGNDVRQLAEDGRKALDAPVPDGALQADHFVFLARGWAVGLAQEAALKLKEAALASTEAYPAMEFRHGPISVIDGRSLVWSLSAPPPGLAAEISSTGARLVTPELGPLAELVKAQRLAVELAASRGLDPDHPRHLSFSVVLRPGP